MYIIHLLPFIMCANWSEHQNEWMLNVNLLMNLMQRDNESVPSGGSIPKQSSIMRIWHSQYHLMLVCNCDVLCYSILCPGNCVNSRETKIKPSSVNWPLPVFFCLLGTDLYSIKKCLYIPKLILIRNSIIYYIPSTSAHQFCATAFLE
jgi:hypothetical protein